MASRTTVTLVDDLDGETADETVEFGLDHAEYEIDLSSAHADELRDVLAPYVAAARRSGGRRSSPVARTNGITAESAASSSPQSRERNQEIRAWAAEHGAALSERGRIPSAVVTAFDACDPAALPAREEASAPEPVASPEPAVTVEPVSTVEPAVTAAVDEPGTDAPARGRDGLTGEERETIRSWADGEGIEVKPRGQLKKDLIANYRAWEARQ